MRRFSSSVGVIAAATILFFTSVSLMPAAAASAAGCVCEHILNGLGIPLTIVPGKQPVLLVHGMGYPPDSRTKDGTPSQWDDENKANKENGKRSLAARLDEAGY